MPRRAAFATPCWKRKISSSASPTIWMRGACWAAFTCARSAKLYSTLGYTYEQQKDYKKAVAAYRKSVELDRDNLDSVRGLAQNLLNDGQTDAALEQYKAIADADPQDAQAHLRLAEIYRKIGKFDAALDSLHKAESMVQDVPQIPYTRALIFEAQGRYDK